MRLAGQPERHLHSISSDVRHVSNRECRIQTQFALAADALPGVGVPQKPSVLDCVFYLLCCIVWQLDHGKKSSQQGVTHSRGSTISASGVGANTRLQLPNLRNMLKFAKLAGVEPLQGWRCRHSAVQVKAEPPNTYNLNTSETFKLEHVAHLGEGRPTQGAKPCLGRATNAKWIGTAQLQVAQPAFWVL